MAIDVVQRVLRCSAEFWMECIGMVQYPLAKRNKLPAINNPLLLKDTHELTNKIRTGELQVETLVSVYIERIKAVNPKLNALVGDRFDEALKEARELDRKIETALKGEMSDEILKLPLLGIPVSVKESIAVRGQIGLTAGLYSRRNFYVNEDASTVKNLKEAGAIILGVTNVPEFLLWYDTNNHVYGRTCNPYDLARISGGSSGGEGSLIASAASLLGIGSDIGGSIRIPSFFCGIFGHKPTPGVTGADGTYPYVGHPEREKFFSIGPMCRYAVDLKPVLKAICGAKASIFRLDEPVDLSKSKFYFILDDQDPLKQRVSPDVKEAIMRARSHLESCGFKCDDAQLPQLRHSFWMWLCAMSDMDAPKLAQELTERQGNLNGWKELSKGLIGKSHFRKITCLNVILENALYKDNTRSHPTFRSFIEKGKSLRQQLDALLDDDSILIVPCLPDKAPKHNGTFLRMNNCGYTAIFNIMDVPVTQVSMGLGTKSRMPVGFQVIAKRLNDRYTLAVAELLAKEFGGWQPPCKVSLAA